MKDQNNSVSENDSNAETLTDTEIDSVSAGVPSSTFGPLKAKIEKTVFDEGKIVKKVIYADASGSGNVTGNGGAPTPKSYTFHEDIDDDLVPVTYNLD